MKHLLDQSEDTFEVDRILGKRRLNGIDYYKVKWTGYSLKSATWEPVHHLKNVMWMLEKFEKRSTVRRSTKKTSTHSQMSRPHSHSHSHSQQHSKSASASVSASDAASAAQQDPEPESLATAPPRSDKDTTVNSDRMGPTTKSSSAASDNQGQKKNTYEDYGLVPPEELGSQKPRVAIKTVSEAQNGLEVPSLSVDAPKRVVGVRRTERGLEALIEWEQRPDGHFFPYTYHPVAELRKHKAPAALLIEFYESIIITLHSPVNMIGCDLGFKLSITWLAIL